MEIVHALQNTTVSTFADQSHRSPVVLEPTSCVRDALKVFSTEKVLSCPIANSKRGADVWGFLDLFDLLSYLLDLWDENQQGEGDGVEKLGETFMQRTVHDLTDRSDNDVYAAVVGGEQAHRLVRLFGLGVHRAALLDLQGNLTNIISQSDVVKYLNSNSHLLGDYANKTIKELNMLSGQSELIIAENDQSAISAFKLIANNLVSAVPLVDKQGTLSGTLSVSDLRLVQEDLSPLLLPVSQYKLQQEPIPSIVCSPSSTLGFVISTLANSNVHRLWVVDDQNKPMSVISITNICEFLSRFMPEEDN